MKLMKTAVAVAIAGIAAAPMMASATTTLSGVVEVKITGSDSEAAATNANGDTGFEAGEAQIASGDVNVNIGASQALNSGLTGYGNLRLDLDSLSNGGGPSNDSIYVGVKGGFGDLRFGEVGNPGEYGQVAGDLHDMGDTIDQGIGYTGSFGGATIGLSYSPAIDQDILAVGAKFSVGGFAIGVGMQDKDEQQNISVGASFSFAGASIALAGAQLGEAAANGDDETHMHAKVGYSIAGVSLGLTYSRAEEADSDKIRFDASYGLGGGMTVSTRINSNSAAGTDSSDWRIQLAKSF